MTALRVLIADDEPLSRDCVRLALGGAPDLEVVAECADGVEAAEAIARLAPDLVFLDIRMPGLDGFGVIDRVGADRMPPVVFVTAYDAHAIRAFALHALDYVLKPFDDGRFAEALAHARAQVALRRNGELARRLSALLRELAPDTVPDAPGGPRPSAPARHAQRVLVHEGDRSVFVPVDEVDWFGAERNYVRLHRGTGSHLIRTTLRHLEGRLDPARFIRIHRSAIVNVARVREVRPWFGGDCLAVLRDGRELRVSRTHRDRLLRPLG